MTYLRFLPDGQLTSWDHYEGGQRDSSKQEPMKMNLLQEAKKRGINHGRETRIQRAKGGWEAVEWMLRIEVTEDTEAAKDAE